MTDFEKFLQHVMEDTSRYLTLRVNGRVYLYCIDRFVGQIDGSLARRFSDSHGTIHCEVVEDIWADIERLVHRFRGGVSNFKLSYNGKPELEEDSAIFSSLPSLLWGDFFGTE